MAKRKAVEKPEESTQKQMFDAMREIEKDKGVPFDVILENIKHSIEKASKSGDVVFNIDPENGVFEAFERKTVVEEVTDSKKEIDLISAREYDVNAGIGEKVKVPINTRKLGRNSVANARSVIRQGIRDKEREITLEEFREKNGEIVSAAVENIDPETGNATVRIGKSLATLPKAEQVGIDHLAEGSVVKVYLTVKEYKEDEYGDQQKDGQKKKNKGPKAIISRRSNEFVKRLFELEVPEISDGTVEIKSVSRDPGLRTKIAVKSSNPNVDSVGACIGARGIRVAKIVEELGGEKIDIIEYKENLAEFIAAALSPAAVISVEPKNEEMTEWRVVVPDGQLSLAIGNRGQNAKLAAKLTGSKIDIRPESGLYGKPGEKSEEIIKPAEAAPAEDAVNEDTVE